MSHGKTDAPPAYEDVARQPRPSVSVHSLLDTRGYAESTRAYSHRSGDSRGYEQPAAPRATRSTVDTAGYVTPKAMKPWEDEARWRALEEEEGKCCSESGGVLCSSHGGFCCSDHGGILCSSLDGVICSSRGGIVCSDHEGVVCSDNGGVVCADKGGVCCSDGRK